MQRDGVRLLLAVAALHVFLVALKLKQVSPWLLNADLQQPFCMPNHFFSVCFQVSQSTEDVFGFDASVPN